VNLSGVLPPIATPFDAQGRIDKDALAENIAKWNPAGLRGYVVGGSNGESALLEPEEIVKALRVVRAAKREEHLLIAGTGRQATEATIRLTQAAAEAGADVALVMTPSFYPAQMTDAALRQHYVALADKAPIPVMIYNVPKFTHLNISADTVAALVQHPNIVGLKDSAGNIGQLIDLKRLCPPDACIMVGNGPAFFSGLQVGASGGILALANVAARECVRIHELVGLGEYAAAREIHFRLMPVGRAVTAGYGVPGLKCALDLLGFRGGNPRPPLLAVSDNSRATIAKILAEAGLL